MTLSWHFLEKHRAKLLVGKTPLDSLLGPDVSNDRDLFGLADDPPLELVGLQLRLLSIGSL